MGIVATQGNTERVFRFQVYDIVKDEFVTSSRLATEYAIDRIGAVRLPASFDIPYDHLDKDGFTTRDYKPV